MIKKNVRTILAIDASINGSGVVLVSNNPEYEKDKISDINGRNFFILKASTTEGVAKKGQTHYKIINWDGVDTIKEKSASIVSTNIRSVFVFENLVRPLLEKYQVTHLVIEGYAHETIGRVFDIGEFTGVLKHLILSHFGHKLNFTEIPPTSMKKYIANSGAAKKVAIDYHIQKNFRLDFKDDDIADAFGLAVMSIDHGDGLKEFIAKKKKPKKVLPEIPKEKVPRKKGGPGSRAPDKAS